MLKPDILYLSHCLPTIPDKGERIRAYHEVLYLSRRYRVHVAAFVRDVHAIDAVDTVRPLCGSFYFEKLRRFTLPYKGLRFLFGRSLINSFYRSESLRKYVEELSREVRFSATIAFTAAMAPYAPAGVPLLVDMVDVDSEKWAEYAHRRSPRWFYGLEADRLRRHERAVSDQAESVILTTEQESARLRAIAPDCRVRAIGNGVDFEYFDPEKCPRLPDLAGRRYIVMVGAMNYFPNSDAAVWFAQEVFPRLRAQLPDVEFLIVGHKPPRSVRRLAAIPGVSVTGRVLDIRPYVGQALAAVTPLRIARGVQNKVLEALAMGKTVLASPQVARTFGAQRPPGLQVCETPDEYCRGVLAAVHHGLGHDPSIRAAARERFSWERNLAAFDEELRRVIGLGEGASA
jgi:sugar transferase (PEP-CTERM/EpsH1 system associated)